MKFLTAFALTASLLSTTACAQSSAAPADKAQIEAVIQDYLLNNPEVLRTALENLEAFEELEMIRKVAPQLYDNPNNVFLGPKDAKVTIVEFFDYNCGYCKQSTKWVYETLEKHPEDVRVVFKELPLLDSRTQTSRAAAKAALAADRQGKYKEMHLALMSASSLTEDAIESMAKQSGLDMEMWKSDIADDVLDDRLEENFRLAGSIPALGGTPFFVIGDSYISGANVTKLQSMLDEKLKS